MVVFIDVLLEAIGSVRLQLRDPMTQTFQIVNSSLRLLAHNCSTQTSIDISSNSKYLQLTLQRTILPSTIDITPRANFNVNS